MTALSWQKLADGFSFHLQAEFWPEFSGLVISKFCDCLRRQNECGEIIVGRFLLTVDPKKFLHPKVLFMRDTTTTLALIFASYSSGEKLWRCLKSSPLYLGLL